MPHWTSTEVRYIARRWLWECKAKRVERQFSEKVDTIVEDRPIALDKWLPPIWNIANDQNGVSSYELARSLGVPKNCVRPLGWRP